MDSEEHPALKDFSPIWESIKHIGGKILKWGAIAAVGLAIGPTIIGALFKGFSLTGLVGSTSFQVGAVAGGLLGAITGISGLGKALDEEKQNRIADYDQAVLAEQRKILLAQGRGQSFSNSAVSVGNMAYHGRGQNQGVPAR